MLCVNKVRNGVIIQSQMYLWLQTDLKQVNLEQTETIDKGRGDLAGSGGRPATPPPPTRSKHGGVATKLCKHATAINPLHVTSCCRAGKRLAISKMLKNTSFRRDYIPPVFHTPNRQFQTTIPRTIGYLVILTIVLSSVNEVACQGVADCVVNGDGLDCFRCSVNITVDVGVEVDDGCSQRVDHGQSLANLTCNSLQDVLESIAANSTVHSVRAFDCIAIVLRSGEHVISSAVKISQNVVWRVEEGEVEEGVGRRVRRQASQPTPSRPMPTTSAPTLVSHFNLASLGTRLNLRHLMK